MSPRATVVIPTLDEEDAIAECLARVQGQTCSDLEVVVADGGSSDRTRDIVMAASARDPRVRLIENPGRIQSAGLNAGVRGAAAGTIVRVDARSFVEPDYVDRCLGLLDDTGAAVVGGRMVARVGDSVVERGIALANGAGWGAGPARFHVGGRPGPVETVYLGAYRSSWLAKVGGWAGDLAVNEDYELNHRIRAAGGVVWLDPSLVVAYQPRATLGDLARQYLRYGRSKPPVMLRHPGSIRARQVVPALLPALAVLAVGRGPLPAAARWSLVLHAALLGAAACRERQPADVTAAGAAAAWIMHWSWSAGFWSGVASLLGPRKARR